MPAFKSLSFYITGAAGRITSGHPLWNLPLAGRSGTFAGPVEPVENSCTIGAYFEAAKAFVTDPRILSQLAGSPELNRDDGPETWDVTLDLQKHGAFYHPVKLLIRTRGNGAPAAFALNGAVTDRGRALARKEGALLAQVGKRFPDPVTPKVLGHGEISGDWGVAGFLLTQWLDGYFEFHMTAGPSRRIVVWRPGEDDLYLSVTQALPLYRHIAGILTRAYNPETGEQIASWHHAAGDFIVAPGQDVRPVRLITIRRYERLMDPEFLGHGGVPGWLFFFIDLCYRMQLDRLDGVGASIFLGREVLSATAQGFFGTIGETLGENAVKEIWDFFSGFSESQILALLMEALSAGPPGPSETDLVAAELLRFAGQIRALFNSGQVSDFY